MDGELDKKKARELLLRALIEKGDYQSAISLFRDDDSNNSTRRFTELLEPISGLADILTKNAQGVFMDELRSQVTQSSSDTAKELAQKFDTAKTELETAVQARMDDESDELATKLADRFEERETALVEASTALIRQLVSERADAMFSTLAEDARLTDDEKQELIDETAFSVETQIPSLVAEYVREQGIEPRQVRGLRAYVQSLIPQIDWSKAVINWSQIKGAPTHFGGGAGARAVKWLNDITNASTAETGTVLKKNANGTFSFEAESGGGGSGVTVETPTGSVDSSNTSFTVTSEPKWIVSDGVTYFDGAGYSYSSLTVTMTIPPSSYIRAIL